MYECRTSAVTLEYESIGYRNSSQIVIHKETYRNVSFFATVFRQLLPQGLVCLYRFPGSYLSSFLGTLDFPHRE